MSGSPRRRPLLRACRLGGGASTLALAIALWTPAKATPPSVVLTYNVDYSGLVSLDVGRATVQFSSAGSGYQVLMSFRPSNSARSFSVGPAMVRTTGVLAKAGLEPQATTLDYSIRKLAETRSFTFAGNHLESVQIVKKKSGGLFKDASTVGYDPRQLPAYTPLVDAEQRNVLDPLSAMFLPITGTALDRANCNRRVRMYDGRRRFDLVMSYRGVEAATVGGTHALVCETSYVPIAGQSVDGDDFTRDMRDYRIAVALVQAPGLPFLVPTRITLMGSDGATVAEAKAIAIAGR